MRPSSSMLLLMLAVSLMGCTTSNGNAGQSSKNEAQCVGFGFEQGTDAFANCMMQLSLRQGGSQQPDHDTLVNQYRSRSKARQGDDRYPVCSAANMDAELDITTGKWVGPDCQMAPD
ncbi:MULTISPECIES: hypothetical protein [unclassified Mesorhizobium]|uniref:hypothetical protein n=1 Tax=unclassified Mesorhizobium TaxID=325217 RepID=UPI000F74DD55|nr:MULTISPECIES: hypothetical protein [unclassified Mesorhizobium]AZO05681.1 hypothetical protein EJ068_23425 [Mesorhizobium sp. M2A.F.Ca.ET.043.02.1.1]RUW41954.1 hypothetical protein EOA37_07730 [Mesorhizobium sp. M2A.F.Ca.ET.015.02.1.1]RUW72162.1 hypothetical protein EOA28_20925 [Mesorhizobium sp. M2A.F.Ca.ET.067.02.1.1]RVC92367.1 hypothetical protein EN739_25900 [Mesorhizobium sp. M2A.F.Ca.ET.017.03.2.1]RVC94872.1 hypothetical protein EN753_32575 [Mesorhizobium sp. M2A.F.Ca.ET.029.05.1.1]